MTDSNVKWKICSLIQLPTILHDVPSTTLIERLQESRYELCGEEGVDVVMHHVRKLSLLKGGKPWEDIMLKRRRKTLVVCDECNSLIQKVSKHMIAVSYRKPYTRRRVRTVWGQTHRKPTAVRGGKVPSVEPTMQRSCR